MKVDVAGVLKSEGEAEIPEGVVVNEEADDAIIDGGATKYSWTRDSQYDRSNV